MDLGECVDRLLVPRDLLEAGEVEPRREDAEIVEEVAGLGVEQGK